MRATQRLPLVFDIRHFALDDGPGIRTTVFFKGCPLSCAWCHNPESIDAGVQLGFEPNNCVGCGHCMEICSEDAITLSTQRRIIQERCNACFKCAEACPAKAIRLIGCHYSTKELVDLLIDDRVFYQTSGGGVTFSGGEPTLYADYLGDVAGNLKRQAIHVALQTCGLFDIDTFKEKLLPFVDLLYFDLKLMSPDAHRKYTGRSNRQILHNFIALSHEPGLVVVPTVPLVPGITATAENLMQTMEFLNYSGCHRYELRPYHPGGRKKRAAIGLDPLPGVSVDPIPMEEQLKIDHRFQAVLGRQPRNAVDSASSAVEKNHHSDRSVG